MQTASPKGKIIVFGILFWYPLAGVTYQFLHYLIGLRRLGYDPYYIEDSGRWVYDPRINDLTPGRRRQHRTRWRPVLEAHGFGDRWAFRGNYPDGQCYGMTEAQIAAAVPRGRCLPERDRRPGDPRGAPGLPAPHLRRVRSVRLAGEGGARAIRRP